MTKRLLTILLAIVMLVTAFTACGSTGNDTSNKTGDSTGEAKTSDKAVVNVTAGPEPETIDPAKVTAADNAEYVFHVFEGLTKLDKDGNIVPGAAKEWKIDSTGTKYTFTIKDDAKWSDGKPVTAGDFEYAWKRALDPKTASDYAGQLFYLKNGEEFNQGKAKAEDVGVKAKDDKTLEVELKAPTGYFLSLTNFQTLMPIRKDIVEKYGDKWTQGPESYIGNGAYIMKEWKHNSEIVMTPNPNYYDKNSLKLTEIHWKLTDDFPAALNAFESGEIDYNDRSIPTAELPKLMADKKTTPSAELGINYVVFNVKKPPVDNPKVRKALALALDRQYLCDKVLQGGQVPAVGLVPYGTPGADPKTEFRKEADAATFFQPTADIEGAKKLLAEAGYPDGKGLPEIEFSTNTNEQNNKLAEAIQAMWAKIGVKAKIASMEWKVFIQYRDQKKDHTVARGAWSADYADPMTFMDMWMTNNGNNSTNWSSKQYDDLVRSAQNTGDQKVRMKAMHDAEKVLMDEMPITPITYRVNQSLIAPKLKGIYRNAMGIFYMQYAYWEK